ncbi:acyl-CoA thioesterase [Ornithinimicrobium cavernae]|uniref:acyl-CoA thioesterase n=1 Tax=Ornithinimicrobium cavernae TaxID=2666047 RepID=UPI000D698357|nr:thioesterase family protein [Ornithinimicrobium cavernae]
MPRPAPSVPPTAATVEVPVRWSDMDAYGHVNNVQYLRYLEEARVYAFNQWFGQERSLLEDGVLVARSEIDYLAPMTFNYQPALVTLWCSRISGASFDIAYVVRQGGTDLTFAQAESTLVTYDLTAARPRRLADHERAAIETVLGEPLLLRSHKERRHEH